MCGADERDNAVFMIAILYRTVWFVGKLKFRLSELGGK
jgi:hypothetical protein